MGMLNQFEFAGYAAHYSSHGIFSMPGKYALFCWARWGEVSNRLFNDTRGPKQET